MSLKVGAVVVLKSGGPQMTVVRIMSDNRFYCTWFDASGKATDKEFPGDALSLFVENSKNGS